MNLITVLTAFASFSFFMIGVDKFILFLEPPCSLMDTINPIIWKVLGFMQIAAGILLWLPKWRKYVAGFFTIFMMVFTIYHLTQQTYDIGGSAFMAVVLTVIFWNPEFLNGKKQ